MSQPELVSEFSDKFISGRVTCDQGIYTVTGSLHWGFRNGAQLLYRAAEPADLRLSIKGSGLPFPNAEHAFGPTNSGHAKLDGNGRFQFQVINPNSYYKSDITKHIGQGKILVEPILYLTIVLPDQTKKTYEVDLGRGIPLRSLTSLPNKWIRSQARNGPTYIH